MPVGERDHGALGREVLQAFERIGHEARLGLLAVRDHGGARRLEALDGVANGVVLKRAKLLEGERARGERAHRVDQCLRPRDAADGFGRDHAGAPPVSAACGWERMVPGAIRGSHARGLRSNGRYGKLPRWDSSFRPDATRERSRRPITPRPRPGRW